jgi:hypothetical protein
LYEEGRVLSISDLVTKTPEQIDAINTAQNLFGSFDPAIGGGKIILDVVAAVFTTTSSKLINSVHCTALHCHHLRVRNVLTVCVVVVMIL